MKTALQLSGGKDSVACLYLMRPQLETLTVYHVDGGDEPPETKLVLEECKKIIPHYVEIKSDSRKWIEENGYPSDVVPTSSTYLGRMMGFGDLPLSDKFSCCFHNIMKPMYDRMKVDGVELIIRGQKLVDMPKVPAKSGESLDGFKFYFPLENWTDEDVFKYLKEVKAPIHDVYSVVKEGIDCLHCTAWWDKKGIDWLKVRHPKEAEFVSLKHMQIKRAVEKQLGGFHA